MQDSYEVFSSWDSLELHKFVTVLERAKGYIDLTMRDDFLLGQAKNILDVRGYQHI